MNKHLHFARSLSVILMLILALPAMALAKPVYDTPSRWEIMRMVVNEAGQAGIDPALALAVARVESNFSADAKSHAGAIGVMQVMPRTARTEFYVAPRHLYDARTNIRIGTRFLKRLINAYDGRVDIALSHYNGGSRVRKPDGRLRVLPQTRDYVRRVQHWAQRYRHHPLVKLAKRNWPDMRGPRTRQAIYLDDFSDPNSRLNRVMKRRHSVVNEEAARQDDVPGYVDEPARKRIMELRQIRKRNLSRARRIAWSITDGSW